MKIRTLWKADVETYIQNEAVEQDADINDRK